MTVVTSLDTMPIKFIYLWILILALSFGVAIGADLEPLVWELEAISATRLGKRINVDAEVRKYIRSNSDRDAVITDLSNAGFRCFERKRPQDIRAHKEQGFDQAFDCTRGMMANAQLGSGAEARISMFLVDTRTKVVIGRLVRTWP
jgi:hypothetical protein